MKRILLVDDHQMARSALRIFLENQGYACVESNNGPEALALLDKGQSVDLIITDNLMPVMTGLEFLGQLANRLPSNSLPVILYSGILIDDVKQQALEAGAFAVLSKPYNFRDLVATVTQALEHR